MLINETEQDLQILFYKDLLESFFAVNYPSIEKDKFWNWFNHMLIGKAICITELNQQEKTAFLNKLKEQGDSLLKSSLAISEADHLYQKQGLL
jgi:hypothetical protein